MDLCTLCNAEGESDPGFDGFSDYTSQSPGIWTCSCEARPSEALQTILQGRDVFVSVPTGYGKSLIFQMLSFCASFMLERLGKATAEVPSGGFQ